MTLCILIYSFKRYHCTTRTPESRLYLQSTAILREHKRNIDTIICIHVSLGAVYLFLYIHTYLRIIVCVVCHLVSKTPLHCSPSEYLIIHISIFIRLVWLLLSFNFKLSENKIKLTANTKKKKKNEK